MVPLYCLLRSLCFYLKLLELILAVAGTIILAFFVTWHYDPDRQTMIALALALPNSVITLTLLLLSLIYEVQGTFADYCFNGTSAIVNIVMGVVLLCHMTNASTIFMSLAIICCTLGGLMMIDTFAIIKGR